MKFKKIIIILILLITISGCSNNKNNTSEIKTLDKAPDSVGEVDKEIGRVLENVGKIERVVLDINLEEEEQGPGQHGQQEQSGSQSTHPHSGGSDGNGEGGSGSGGEEGSGSSGEGGGGSGGEGGGQSGSHGSGTNAAQPQSSESIKEQKNKELWMDIDKSIEAIHLQWSSYENEGVQKGASRDRVVQLKDAINKLTKSIEERNIISIYDFGSQSLLNLKPFYDLYKDDYRGEICELKHSVYQYYIKALAGDTEGAAEEFASKENNINRIRMLIGEDEKKNKELEKISASIDSIGISLDEGSRRVFMLEKDTLIKNLESLE